MMYAPNGIGISLSLKLDFPYLNETEYEALVIRLISVLQMVIRRLCVQGDSRLKSNKSTKKFALEGFCFSSILN